MRAVIQRVLNASIEINKSIYASIDQGLLVLIGIENSDNSEDIEWLAGKIARLRIFNDLEGVMNCSVSDINGEILLVSQFTLHASTKKGNRPSYIRASSPDLALPLYEGFIERLKNQSGLTIKTGIFGAEMKINLINDGPVTIIIDTKNRE
jgi:D-tyrosyl-tRNA(Tyr) deacylase